MLQKKVDPRNVQSRDKIKKVFLSLLDEKPFDLITVKEISSRAQINRSTFYRHYQDVFQLLIECVSEGVTLLEDPPSGEEVYKESSLFINRVQRTLDFYKQTPGFSKFLLSQYAYSPYLRNFVQNLLEHQYSLQRAVLADESSYKGPNEILAQFCVAGVSQSVYAWIDEDLPCSSEELAVYIAKLNILTIAVMSGMDSNKLPIAMLESKINKFERVSIFL